ncbi:glycosyltransferase family 4 protein [Acinetobacter sp. A3.8]|uniref:Glycosyltransferase family 4 protein n=1 Tax=Acinetobacter sedimenti TaxID=2919922 RepID=A0A9X1WW92_9GAMM|nr:glycosyltransferase family 4 protein [Acinetobacter sedimenti]MCJ8146354.1 glycosyltransferase family 4 protein [Acinetobacter sedimenti]
MIRVAISYRVLQSWRVPVFERLSRIEGLELCVFYSDDFEGTKVKSYKGNVGFPSIKLQTRKFSFTTRNGKAYIPYNPNLYTELDKFNPDVIIVEGASNLINNVICFIYSKKKNKKIIQWGLGEIEGRKKSIHRRLADIFFNYIEKKSDAAISYSSYGSEYYKKIGIDENRVFTAVNVVDTEKRLKEIKEYCLNCDLEYPSPLPQKHNFLFVGALSENKNVDLLIKVFSKLCNLNDNIHLTIVGDGPLRNEFEKLAFDLNVNDHVSFSGNQTVLAPYMYNATLMVLPGLGGLAISDALIHGVPVVCTIGDGCEKDLIVNNGLIIKNINEDNLFENLQNLILSKSELIRMRKEAQNFEFSKFNINNYVDVIYRAVRYVCN